MGCEEPDFYLNSTESYSWGPVRRAYVLRKLRGPRSSGYWLVKVDPPIYVTGFPDCEKVILAERHRGCDLSDLKEGYLSVYVCQILNGEVVSKGEITEENVTIIYWADIARDMESLPDLPNPHSEP